MFNPNLTFRQKTEPSQTHCIFINKTRKQKVVILHHQLRFQHFSVDTQRECESYLLLFVSFLVHITFLIISFLISIVSFLHKISSFGVSAEKALRDEILASSFTTDFNSLQISPEYGLLSIFVAFTVQIDGVFIIGYDPPFHP